MKVLNINIKAFVFSLLPHAKSTLLFVILGFFSTVLFAQHKTFEEQTKIKKLKNVIKQLDNDSLKAIKLMELSREIHRKKHQEKKEYQYARQAVDLTLTLNDTILYARALDNLGLLYRYHKKYGQAIPLHTKAFNLAENNQKIDPLYKMIFGNNAGVAARYAQQYDLAVEYYLKSLKIAEDKNNIKNIAISSNGLGNALGNISGREDEAFNYFLKSLKAEKQKKDSLGMAMDYLSISGYFINNKQYKEALNYLDTLYDINDSRNDKFGLAITNQFYGNAYFEQGKKLDLAKNYYLKALKQYQALGNHDHKAEVLRSLGHFYMHSGNLTKALKYYTKSLDLADSTGYKSLISENSFSISEIKEKQGDYSTAFSYHKKAEIYEDSIALAEQKVKIAALTNKYELNQKETKIAFLQNENTLKEKLVENQKKEIQTHKIYFVVLISGILIIFLFILIQYKTRKAKKKAEELLRQNREELLKAQYEKSIAQAEMIAARTQLNPHFLFNCLTGIHLMIQKNQTQKADRYLINLSRFLRMILEIPKSESISLQEEIRLIKYYVNLEEKRFNDDFYFNLKTLSPQEMEAIKIPPLLLQPFVENAIWHGLLPVNKKEKKLDIIITRKDSDIKIIIEDNGVGRSKNICKKDQKLNKNKSLGTQITQDRINHFNKSYDTKISVQFIDKINPDNARRAGTKIILTISKCIQAEKLTHKKPK